MNADTLRMLSWYSTNHSTAHIVGVAYDRDPCGDDPGEFLRDKQRLILDRGLLWWVTTLDHDSLVALAADIERYANKQRRYTPAGTVTEVTP